MRKDARFALLGASAAAIVGLAVASACSLGLDPSLMGNDGSMTDAKADGGIDAPNPVQCKTDPDCKPNNACLTGHCDTAKGQCVYDLCPANACNASTCDPNLHTCSVPNAYGFHAGTFHVALGNAGCGGGGGGARRCFAAVYPFVFIGTTNGVVAYAVDNPTSSAPPAIQVAGLPFFPVFIVASGPRVYFVGSVAGTGSPDYKVPMAWVDVPTDPTVGQIAATTVFDTLQLPSIDGVHADAAGGIYLVRFDAAKSYPAAQVTAPLKDLDSLTFSATAGLPSGSSVAAASGSRLITFRQDNSAWDTYFSLETSAATASAQNAGEQSLLATTGQSAGLNYLAPTPSGGLLWSASSIDAPDGGPVTTVTARLAWVLADQNATKFDATTHVDVNTYNLGGANTDLPGPVAWIDDNTALVISAPPSSQAQSIVQIATRSGTPSVVPNRSFQLAFHPSELAATGSNGYGYVLTPDATSGVNVHVFGAGCNN